MAIQNFKLWCIENKLKVPQSDEEILRNLIGAKFSIKNAYADIYKKNVWQKDHLPLLFNAGVKKLLEQGVVYVYGRDKCYRPVLHVSVQNLFNMDPQPTSLDLTSLVVALNMWTDTNMMAPGRIENRVLILDLKDLGVMSFPYALVKSVMGTM